MLKPPLESSCQIARGKLSFDGTLLGGAGGERVSEGPGEAPLQMWSLGRGRSLAALGHEAVSLSVARSVVRCDNDSKTPCANGKTVVANYLVL